MENTAIDILNSLLKEFKSPLFYFVGALILTSFLVTIYLFNIEVLGIWKFLTFLVDALFTTIAASASINFIYKKNKIKKYLKNHVRYLSQDEITILRNCLEKFSQSFSVPVMEDTQHKLVNANSLVHKCIAEKLPPTPHRECFFIVDYAWEYLHKYAIIKTNIRCKIG